MKRLALFALLALVLAAAAAAIVSFGGSEGQPAGPLPAADPAHTPPEATRVVVVSRQMPSPSQTAQTLHGRLEEGRMPQTQLPGVVLTDSECTPGIDGISRCRNEVRLADGSTIVLRHPHDMATVPCLTPGEHVLVAPA